MSSPEMPMNAAHQHAANADDHLAQGYLIPAAEEHYKAAEGYMAAAEQSNDESAKRTLRMLYNKHNKAGKDLQRKIAKLREEGKDPSQRQKPEPQQATPAVNPAQLPRQIPSPPPVRPHDLQNTVDESFMLLGGQRSDPGDAFNQFWHIMQGMLDNLSQPVAFATAIGLENDDSPHNSASSSRKPRDGSLSSDTDGDEPLVSRFKRRIGMTKSRTTYPPSLTGSSGLARAATLEDEFDDDMLDVGDELSESFCLVPSGSEPSLAAQKRENAALKAEIEALQSRLEATERVIQLRKDQDLHLRESIVMARREAQRAMGASTMAGQRPPVDLSSLNLNVPPIPIPGLTPGREAQYTRRIKELEDEVRGLRADNEKQKAMIAKFRERWEKLKESAKRKKEAKAGSTPIRERIVEEPEAEQELDGV
ncbi:hypothetical protein PTI98_002937 [Pleurotus ostreatus]|nr:hypothetical protein PTI98_002937 [Pleurotus ostreatus]